MAKNTLINRAHVEYMLSMIYRDGEKPTITFLEDLERVISGAISIDELRNKIIAEYAQGQK